MLEEARAIKGVSLGKDAWRRLRKNPMAMVSLWMLLLLAVGAVLTPLLPLQPPRLVDTDRQFTGPVLHDVVHANDVEDNVANDENAPRPLRDTLDEGFGELGPFSGLLLKIRLAIFGDWSIPSVCGTDELGRDVLARLFWLSTQRQLSP